MKITNLEKISSLLKNEVSDTDPSVTKKLKVIIADEDSIVVASSVDADLSIRLRGVKFGVVGDSAVVTLATGDVVLYTAVPTSTPEKKPARASGCKDRSAIVR